MAPVPGSVRAYYQSAGERATLGDDAAALEIVRQGLRHYDASELHLLAAILCQRVGSTEAMRAHVAAIPVDDSLRAEAEWLLRTRSLEDADVHLGQADAAVTALLAPPPTPAPTGALRRKRRWATLALMLLGVGLAWTLTQFGFIGNGTRDAQAPTEISAPATDAAAPGQESPGRPDAPADKPEAASTAPPVRLPTPTIAPDLVEESAGPEPLAAAETGLAQSAQFDLDAYLAATDSQELVELNVAAQIVDAQLYLTGYVETYLQREELLSLAEVAPGVDLVSAAELYIRPPATYTVQAGDSLWTISYAIYGDVGRMEDVYAANRDVMASPESLTIGMVLKLPRYAED